MKCLKFTGIFIVLALFVLGVIAMSFYTGYQYAKTRYLPQIDSIWDSYGALATNYRDMKATADYWEWQAVCYKSGAEVWASDYVRDTQALKDEISLLKEQLNSKPKEVTIPLEDWASLDELKEFLKEDNTDRHTILIANEKGEVFLDGRCRVKAEQLRDNAFAIGKRLETESLTRTEAIMYFDIGQKLSPWDRHEVCKALIGNEIWFVEPSSDQIFMAYYIPY